MLEKLCLVNGLSRILVGAQVDEVLEHLELRLSPSSRTVIVLEIEAYPEPKALNPADLKELTSLHGGYKQTARAIGGVSEGFVRQNVKA